MNLLPFAKEPSLLDKAWTAIRYPIDLVHHPMDALLNLPALSFLLIPAFSSYGTTINLLFFYMTWAVLIKSNPPLQVELVGTLAIRVLFYILPSSAFLLFDSVAPRIAVNLKERGDIALPMGSEQGGATGRWWKVALVSCFNVLIGIALQAGTELLFTRIFHVRSALKLSTGLPMPWSVAKDLMLSLLLREILTYGLHRYVLHSPASPLTKMHQTWQHSIKAPSAFVAHYDHPFAYIMHVFLPMFLPAVILRLHLLTYQLYLIIVSLEETLAYSGYNVLPSGLIMGGIARRQERHLMGGGDGNYGCLGLADYAMGSSVGGDVVDDLVDEAGRTENELRSEGRKRISSQTKASKKKKRSKDSASEKEDDSSEDDDVGEAEAPVGRLNSRGGTGDGTRHEDEEADSTDSVRDAEKKIKKKEKGSKTERPSSGLEVEDQRSKGKQSSTGRKAKKPISKPKR